MGERKSNNKKHDDCKENQIAKLGISVAFTLFVQDFSCTSVLHFGGAVLLLLLISTTYINILYCTAVWSDYIKFEN